MRVVVAPNAFKGALGAPQAAEAMATGARVGCPWAEVVPVPMADGGDGTAETLRQARGGEVYTARVVDPWGRPVRARFVMLPDRTAVVEVAAASGLGRRRPGPAQALAASTRGTGALVMEAVRRGARRVLVALGGSATSDGGAGLLQALGAVVTDASGRPLGPGGGTLHQATRVNLAPVYERLRGVEVSALADVTAPLLGPEGAAARFGPQKGMAASDIPRLESGLAHWAALLEAAAGRQGRDRPGAGAAGGTGFALAVALGAELLPGGPAIAEAVGLAEQLATAGLALTGEGVLDRQTAQGKAPAVVGQLAAAAKVPCCALVGALGEGWREGLAGSSLTAVFPLGSGPRPRTAALRSTAEDLAAAAEMVVRLWARAVTAAQDQRRGAAAGG